MAVKNITVDQDGNHRCWNCGGTNFTLKRTRKSKVLVGVGTFATKKKKHCQDCGEYNALGNAEAADSKWVRYESTEGSRIKKPGHYDTRGRWVTPGGMTLDEKPPSAVEAWELEGL